VAGGLDVAEIARVGEVATGGLLPDLTLVLDVGPEVARERTGPARDRVERRPPEYQAKVRAGFLNASGIYDAPVVTIDAGAGADQVFARIQREVGRVLGISPRP
jgi:dTMP kinase